jgi:hypothetical protein
MWLTSPTRSASRVWRIVFEQFSHRLLELFVVLVGILADVECLRRGAAPNEMPGARVEQFNHQRSDFDRRGCHPPVSPSAPLVGSPTEAIELLLLRNRALVAHLEVTAVIHSLEALPHELLVYSAFDIPVQQLVAWVNCLLIHPLVSLVGREVRRSIVIKTDLRAKATAPTQASIVKVMCFIVVLLLDLALCPGRRNTRCTRGARHAGMRG